ncbi:hypothetical protein V2J09_003925 [Rumex salicifolius]
MRSPKHALPIPPITLQFCFLLLLHLQFSRAQADASVMEELKTSLKLPSTVKWSDSNPCKWDHVVCDSNSRVTRIQLGNLGVSGTLPSSLSSLSNLQVFELMGNTISGALPNLAGLSSLQMLNLHDNSFTSIPSDFFKGMTSLVAVYLDKNPLGNWSIPDSLQEASSLQNFSANSVNLIGPIPGFISPNTFPSLAHLHLSSNHLAGELPSSFSGLPIQSLWLNGQTFTNGTRSLGGSIAVLQNMTDLVQILFNMNAFTGPIPDLSKLTNLKDFNLRDNSLTGPVPDSLTALTSLQTVNLTNNALQGPTPKFPASVELDMIDGRNSFCLTTPGLACDSRVDALISFMGSFGYPLVFAQSWTGNDPCANSWMGIACASGNITVVNLPGKGLTGTISPSIARLTSVQTLNLAHNYITGTIPVVLTTMPNLKTLDVSYNQIYGKVPTFTHTNVITTGNANIGKDAPPSSAESPPGSSSSGGSGSGSRTKTGIIVGVAVSVLGLGLVVGLSLFCLISRRKRKASEGLQRPNGVVVHPSHSESGDAVKITIATSSAGNGSEGFSLSSSTAPSDVHVIEGNNLVISIQVLRSVTNDFSETNVLGKGGFGVVYKGELHDGTNIAVKRMNSGVLGDKGLTEFTSEIAVLTKVRHRHLVGLLGYCVDGCEKLLVYEYMPQGPLSQHLFDWKEDGLKPLDLKQRLAIALDVARGVEYLHNLAHQSFIHRDLKPSNILLGDDMRAKVADFGLVRLAPDGGKTSIETRLAGTFGYLAPEYAVMGRITTKVDVFSFGVILMELITGRKALDETQPEDSVHLVTWFRRAYNNKDTFRKSIDPTIELNDETRPSIERVAELASHCCARDPHQRPDMGHTVNVLSSLVEMWKPSDEDSEDNYGIDLDMSLPQALKKWQAQEGFSNVDNSATSSSSFFGSDTQTSIPTRPSGFAVSFASDDGR